MPMKMSKTTLLDFSGYKMKLIFSFCNDNSHHKVLIFIIKNKSGYPTRIPALFMKKTLDFGGQLTVNS